MGQHQSFDKIREYLLRKSKILNPSTYKAPLRIISKEKNSRRCISRFYNNLPLKHFHVTVNIAQLVERWIVAPEVAGSSPSIHP